MPRRALPPHFGQTGNASLPLLPLGFLKLLASIELVANSQQLRLETRGIDELTPNDATPYSHSIIREAITI